MVGGIGNSYGYNPYYNLGVSQQQAMTPLGQLQGSSTMPGQQDASASPFDRTRQQGVTIPGQTENAQKLPGQEEAKGIDPDQEKKPGRKSSPEDCETCKNRKYQDGSDEVNVSFKNAAHVSPEAAGAAVRAHEAQHVSNAYKKAAEDKNAEVVSADVSIHTAICPECGRSYVSGGTTHTQIKYTNESNPYQKDLKAQDGTNLRGANVDFAV